jgi:hypothetical protein
MKILNIYDLLYTAHEAAKQGSYWDDFHNDSGRVCVIRSYTDTEEDIFLEGDWDTPELGYMFESQVVAMLPTEEEFFNIKNYRFESDGVIYRAFPV